jgi:hypothetical protein
LRVFALASAIVLSGCAEQNFVPGSPLAEAMGYHKTYAASPAPPQPTREELDARGKAWAACVIDNVERLDDNRSDAGTIAVAVRSACHKYTAGPLTNEELGQITQVVLSFRANKAPSDAEIDAQVKAWADCLDNKITEVDDGKVAPETVAQAAMPQCPKLYGGLPEKEKLHITDIVMIRRKRGPQPVVVTPPTPEPPAEKRF